MARQGLRLILAKNHVNLAAGGCHAGVLARLVGPELAGFRFRFDPGVNPREHDKQVGRSPAVLPGALTNLAARLFDALFNQRDDFAFGRHYRFSSFFSMRRTRV